MNGLWVAHFNAGPAHGNGLAVFRSGEILGGDLAHTWTGTYQEEGDRLYARVRVAPYVSRQNGEPGVPERTVMMTLSGSCDERDATLTGHADESEVAVSVEMHKAN
ncbi:MAG TPA: GrlR family regulatory protein [Acidobacteriaceae bacterium]|nr:GrlR family regulatory protein [Acidobacteriaceae bacterium]